MDGDTSNENEKYYLQNQLLHSSAADSFGRFQANKLGIADDNGVCEQLTN
jgi:hypothetical protein